jgi:hypothetical protein
VFFAAWCDTPPSAQNLRHHVFVVVQKQLSKMASFNNDPVLVLSTSNTQDQTPGENGELLTVQTLVVVS